MTKVLSHLFAAIVGFGCLFGYQTLTEPKPDPFKDKCWFYIHACLVNQEFYKDDPLLSRDFSMVGQQFAAALEVRSQVRFDEAWINYCNIQEPEMKESDLKRMRDAELFVEQRLK